MGKLTQKQRFDNAIKELQAEGIAITAYNVRERAKLDMNFVCKHLKHEVVPARERIAQAIKTLEEQGESVTVYKVRALAKTDTHLTTMLVREYKHQ